MGFVGIVVDSNVLLEHLKGTIDLTKIRKQEKVLFINNIVISEVL
jgi:predicted nucleic acid-binding protein